LRLTEFVATAEQDPYTGAPETHYDFSTEDSERLREFTREHVGQAYAVIENGRMLAVATIIDEIGDSMVITGLGAP